MTRLKKALHNKGIIWDEPDIPSSNGVDTSCEFLGIFNNIIVVVFHSNVLSPMFRLYDNNLKLIGGQDFEYDDMLFCGTNHFSTFANLPKVLDDDLDFLS